MTTKPKLNVSLLKRIVKHLREEPKRYDQGKWGKQIDPESYNAPACGIQGCIAGWAVFLSIPEDLWPTMFAGNAFLPTGNDELGLNDSACTRAAHKLLGLTRDEAHALFSADNHCHTTGKEGVKEAVRKINTLIRDRAEFVRQFN